MNNSFLEREVLLSFSLIIAVLALAIYNLRRNKWISFGIFWFFTTLIPVYNIIPLFNPMAERYLYLPCVGFFMIISPIFIDNPPKINKFLKTAKFIGLIALVAFYSIITVMRNFDWKNEEILWQKTAASMPDNWKIHNGLGTVYSDKGEYTLALNEFKAALRF